MRTAMQVIAQLLSETMESRRQWDASQSNKRK